MDRILDRKHFRALFADRAIVVADLGPGGPRDLAAGVNQATGRGDAVLHTRAEYDALFDAVARDVAHAPAVDAAAVAMADDEGRPTPAGATVHAYLAASIGKRELFGWPMCQVEISGWPASQLRPEEPVIADGSRLSLSRADPQDARRVPPPVDGGVLFTSTTFSLMNSGQMTKYSPKRSWKVDLDPGDDDDRIVGMARLNLKSMYNDPSQMREALAWRLFAAGRCAAPRHTYARLGSTAATWAALADRAGRQGFLGDRFGETAAATCTRSTAAAWAARRSSTGAEPTATTAAGSTDLPATPASQTYRLKSY